MMKTDELEAGRPEAAKPEAGQPGAERFLVLDGMRGVAAFAVILDHVSSETLRQLLPGRYLAVDFFFILSGFVLAHAYGRRLDQGLSVFAFLRIRLIRLYPLYLLGFGIGLAAAVYSWLRGWSDASGTGMVVAAVFGLAFLPVPPPPLFGFRDNPLFPFNGPAWTLFFEIAANVIYALVARFLSWRVFAIGLPIAAALTAFTIMRHVDVGPGWLWRHFDAGMARVLFGFFTGVFIYKLRSVWTAPAVPAWLAFGLFLAVICLPVEGPWRRPFDALAAIVLLPLIVTVSASARIGGPVARVCGALGLLSYGVYVLHVPLMQVLDLGLGMIGQPIPVGFIHVLLVALLAGTAAAIADRYYDGPVRSWLTKSLAGRTSSPPRASHG